MFCHYSTIWGYFLTNLTQVKIWIKNNICFRSGFENDCCWFGLLLADTGPSGSIAHFTPLPANHHVALLPESVPHLGSRDASAGALPPCWLRGWSSPRREMTIKPQQITQALNSVFGCKSSETWLLRGRFSTEGKWWKQWKNNQRMVKIKLPIIMFWKE